ncbi:MAG TPA: hypothetical protein ENH82_16625 [bacterium]|nr:hypothetical protein [bacterium]
MDKRTMEKLKKLAVDLLLEQGFTATPKRYKDYIKHSILGEIGVSVRISKNYKRRGYHISIFGVYCDPTEAIIAGICCDFYTGKHNFHILEDEASVEYAINQYAVGC